jgi:hypothetical protein
MPHPSRPRSLPLAIAGLVAALGLAACTGAGATASPSAAMMDESPSPSAAMMDESPSPSAAMMDESPSPVSTGAFHGVDGTATGTVALFHQADGSFVVTFEDFSINEATGIHVVVVTNKDVMSSSEIDKAAIVDLGPLKATSGMQDFPVPASADAMTYHTVVLWDTAMAHAVAAAPLQ